MIVGKALDALDPMEFIDQTVTARPQSYEGLAHSYRKDGEGVS